jgi:multiple sugar transport system substrate-binding protein
VSVRLAAVLGWLVLVAGCGARRDEAEVLRFWAMGREAEIVAELVPQFEREHPGIVVEVQQLAWTAAHEKLLTAFAGNSLPDLCQLGNTWIAEFASLDALEPLDARVQRSATVDRDDYFPGIWATGVLGDTTYGVPWYVDTRLLFYRRDLLAAAGYDHPPRTWDEWHRMLVAVKRRAGPERYAVLLPLNEFEPLQVLALQQPEPMLRDGGRYGNFRSESFRRALGFYARMFDEGLAPKVSNTQISNVWLEFGNGYYAFYVSGPWNIGEFRRRLPPERQGSWTTAPMPGPEGPGASNAGGSSLVIFRSSRRKDAAWAFVEFLSRPAIQARLHELAGDLPPRRSAWSHASLARDPYVRAFREQLERVRPLPQVPEWERIMEEMRLTAERVTQGAETLEEGVANLDARVDRILEKRRFMLAREARR